MPYDSINDTEKDFFLHMCEEVMANPEKFNNNEELKILVYFTISSTDHEIFSFIRTFFKKYDKDGFYMLSFQQFRDMMESMARKFSTETMNNYFLMLDRFNFMQNDQKDKLLAQREHKDDYFGPFVMECIFKIFMGDHPLAIHGAYEKRTDFWKFLPFLFNMTMLENMREIKLKKEKFYVKSLFTKDLIGFGFEDKHRKASKSSLFSIMSTIKGLGSDTSNEKDAVKVSFSVIEKTLQVYKTLNVLSYNADFDFRESI